MQDVTLLSYSILEYYQYTIRLGFLFGFLGRGKKVSEVDFRAEDSFGK